MIPNSITIEDVDAAEVVAQHGTLSKAGPPSSHPVTTPIASRKASPDSVRQSKGLFTPPASEYGSLDVLEAHSMEATAADDAEPKTNKIDVDLKADKKAAKQAKRDKKKKKEKQQQATTAGAEAINATGKAKPTLADQIVQGLVEQLRRMARTKDDESDEALLSRLIGRQTDGSSTAAAQLAPSTSLLSPTPHPTLKPKRSFQSLLLFAQDKPLPSLPMEKPTVAPLCAVPPSTSDEGDSMQRMVSSVYTLHDFSAMRALEHLFEHYGRTSHMGILDPSYRFFVNKQCTAALYYKIHDRVAVVAGDPLCEPGLIDGLFVEFAGFRRMMGLQMAFMGVSDAFAGSYARKQGWTTLHFGTNRALNPVTNPLMTGEQGGASSSSAKRLLTQNRQLMHVDKGGLQLGIYIPALGHDGKLQTDLCAIYDAWRQDRNEKRANSTQAFITVYDPFSLPHLMVYLYTRDRRTGRPNGFAALRRLGAHAGYHLDPCIAAPDCLLRGISDLLVYASMALLHHARVAFLSFGVEPCTELGAVTGLAAPLERLTRLLYQRAFANLPLGGKKAFHDKFRPDDSIAGLGLHIVLPAPLTHPRYALALAHMANVSLRRVFLQRNKQSTEKKKEGEEADAE